MEEPLSPPDQEETALDHDLMARIAGGDHQAFAELVERHQHMVVGTVARMLGDPSEAQDIAQQVFLRIWRNARRYRPDARFTTYLFTVMRNLVFNELRRRKRRNEVSSDEREDEHHLQIEDAGQTSPDEQLANRELQDAIERAIANLPEAQRMAVVLRRYEQLPYEQIAEILEVSLPSVKSLLFRARASLKESLSRYLEA